MEAWRFYMLIFLGFVKIIFELLNEIFPAMETQEPVGNVNDRFSIRCLGFV